MDVTGSGSELTTAKILSTLNVLMILRVMVFLIGFSIGFGFELKIIFQRFCAILNIKDKRMIQLDPITKQKVLSIKKINIDKGSFLFKDLNVYWKTNQLQNPTLKNINLIVKRNSFLGITGKIGSGKSGLLGVLLDQAPYYSGLIQKNGKIAYVEQ